MNQDKIGKFIAQRRKARGFLQKDIAERLGVSEKTISKWECGNGLPEVEIMVCDHLLSRGIPVCRFIKNKQGAVLSTDENGRPEDRISA